MNGVRASDYFYFVHSFYVLPEEKDAVLSTTRYGIKFCSSIWQDNIFATQFHPEKSQTAGLKLVKNFIAYDPIPYLQRSHSDRPHSRPNRGWGEGACCTC